VINITPQLSAGELQNERKIWDRKVREHIRKSNADYLTGRSRPGQDFLSELCAEVPKPRKNVRARHDAWSEPPLGAYSVCWAWIPVILDSRPRCAIVDITINWEREFPRQ
jgi:hypothetical protein